MRLKKLQCYFLYFMLYSILGWIYEVFLEVVVYRWGFSNRGILFGPYCIIYGVGALVLILLLHRLQAQRILIGRIDITPILVFLAIVAITTVLELGASYLMEWVTGGWMWDYTRFSPNFQGRIALNPSLRFGIGGMVFLYLLQPLFKKLTDRLPPQCLAGISGTLAVLFLIDLAFFLFS